MGTSVSNPEFSEKKSPTTRSVSALWKEPSAAPVEPLASLPLGAFEVSDAAVRVNPPRQRERFAALLDQIKQCLVDAKRQSALARSRSTPVQQRQALCESARERFAAGKKFLAELHGVARSLGLEERRKARAVEGFPEWRAIHHAICKAEAGLPRGKGMAA